MNRHQVQPFEFDGLPLMNTRDARQSHQDTLDRQTQRVLVHKLAGNADFDALVAHYNEGRPAGLEMRPDEMIQMLQNTWRSPGQANGSLVYHLNAAVADLFPGVGNTASSSWEASPRDPQSRTNAIAALQPYIGGFHAFVQAQYDVTQASLAAAGIDRVTLYRGMQFDTANRPVGWDTPTMSTSRLPISMNPLNSWTTDPLVALTRALDSATPNQHGYMVSATVPRDSIFSMARTGLGELNTGEVILLGGREDANVVNLYGATEAALRHPPSGDTISLVDGIDRLFRGTFNVGGTTGVVRPPQALPPPTVPRDSVAIAPDVQRSLDNLWTASLRGGWLSHNQLQRLSNAVEWGWTYEGAAGPGPALPPPSLPMSTVTHIPGAVSPFDAGSSRVLDQVYARAISRDPSLAPEMLQLVSDAQARGWVYGGTSEPTLPAATPTAAGLGPVPPILVAASNQMWTDALRGGTLTPGQLQMISNAQARGWIYGGPPIAPPSPAPSRPLFNQGEMDTLYRTATNQGVGQMSPSQIQRINEAVDAGWLYQGTRRVVKIVAPAMTQLDAKKIATDAFEGTFAGFKATVGNVYVSGAVVEIKGDITAANGDYVGQFSRSMYPSTGRVTHNLMTISRSAQGGGFATEFNNHVFEYYKANGYKEVEVHANIDVGGYTWAKQGFNFETDRYREQFINLLSSIFRSSTGGGRGSGNYNTLYNITPAEVAALRPAWEDMEVRAAGAASGEKPTANEISQFGIQYAKVDPQTGRTSWLGKRLMLGSSWTGILDLKNWTKP